MQTMKFTLVRITKLTDGEYARLQVHPYSNEAQSYNWSLSSYDCSLINDKVRHFSMKRGKKDMDYCLVKEERLHDAHEFEETYNGLIGGRIQTLLEEEYGLENKTWGTLYCEGKPYPLSDKMREFFKALGFENLDNTADSVVCIVFGFAENYDKVQEE